MGFVIVWSFIALLWSQTHISLPVMPTCLFLITCALLNVIICTTIHPFFFFFLNSWWAGLLNLRACLVWLVLCVISWQYTTLHSFGSCCNLSKLTITSLLSHARSPLLLSSDNHPGSAPILQLAASSFQNPGVPPHETKSKCQWSARDDLILRAVILFGRLVHRSDER